MNSACAGRHGKVLTAKAVARRCGPDENEQERVRVTVWQRINSGLRRTQPRRQAFVLKLVRTADTVRLSATLDRRVVSCRVVPCLGLVYTLGSVGHRPPKSLFITLGGFSSHNLFLPFLFLILPSLFSLLIMTSLSVSTFKPSSVHSASPLSFHTADSPPSPSPLTASSASSSQISFSQADEG